MNAKDMREKNDEALLKLLAEKRRHLYDLRVQSVTEKVSDTTQFGQTKKDIARIHTILTERKIQTAQPAAK